MFELIHLEANAGWYVTAMYVTAMYMAASPGYLSPYFNCSPFNSTLFLNQARVGYHICFLEID